MNLAFDAKSTQEARCPYFLMLSDLPPKANQDHYSTLSKEHAHSIHPLFQGALEIQDGDDIIEVGTTGPAICSRLLLAFCTLHLPIIVLVALICFSSVITALICN